MMSFEFLDFSVKFNRMAQVLGKDERGEYFLYDDPGSGCGFIVIKRQKICRDFTKAANPLGKNFYQNECLFLFPSKAGFKKMNIRHLQKRKLYSFYTHFT